jgi:ribonuclease BN (tRNA processing enzyme)
MSINNGESTESEHPGVSHPAAECGCSAPVLQSKPRLSRRAVLAGGAAIGAGALAAGPQARARAATVAAAGPSASRLDLGGMSVVLLGTAGGPVPQWPRNMTSNAVIVDGHAYLIDSGNGVVRQIVNAGIPYQAIQDVFITHLHPDHMFDYLPLFVCGRSIGPQPGFRQVVNTYGPSRAGSLPAGTPVAGVTPINPALPTPGLTDTHNGLLDADAYWLNLIYIQDPSTAFPLPGLPSDIRDLVIPHDIPTPNVGASPTGNLCPAMSPFTVFEDSRIKVSAVLVNHPPVFPAYAYRFDTDYGSVVFSGDTMPDTSGNMVRLASGADLLVHEAGYEKDMIAHGTPPKLAENLLGSHTNVTQLGVIAQQAGVRALALNHLISLNPLVAYPPPIIPATWIAPIRKQYTGPVYVGQDLMRFTITSSGITVTQL